MLLVGLVACIFGGGDDSGADAPPSCEASGTLRGAVNATLPSDVACAGRGSSGSGVEGIDFANGGAVQTDRLTLSVEVVNWIPGADGEEIDGLSALVTLEDRDQGLTWRSVDASAADPAGCAFTGIVTLWGPFDDAYLAGEVTCSRPLTETLGETTVELDGALTVSGLGPVP